MAKMSEKQLIESWDEHGEAFILFRKMDREKSACDVLWASLSVRCRKDFENWVVPRMRNLKKPAKKVCRNQHNRRNHKSQNAIAA